VALWICVEVGGLSLLGLYRVVIGILSLTLLFLENRNIRLDLGSVSTSLGYRFSGYLQTSNGRVVQFQILGLEVKSEP
jgi:hypothetical protein